MNLLLVVLGVALLYLGGEGLVRGSASLGRRLGLSPIVIGLTIVSVGTSSPELAASLAGVLRGAPAVSFGNIVGSNIANLSLVLGLTAMIWPLRVAMRVIRREIPFMVAFSALVIPMVWDGVVGRWEGLGLIAILIWYLRLTLRLEEPPEVEAEFEEAFGQQPHSLAWSSIAVTLGILLLIGGAQTLITGAVGLAQSLGVSERVIGLTMVAFGTSLPELASSVVAAVRHQSDIVLGNLIGSNIFNVLFILGATSTLQPVLVETRKVWTDIVVMMVVSLVAWLLLRTRKKLGRIEGSVLVAGYVGYIIYLFAG